MEALEEALSARSAELGEAMALGGAAAKAAVLEVARACAPGEPAAAFWHGAGPDRALLVRVGSTGKKARQAPRWARLTYSGPPFEGEPDPGPLAGLEERLTEGEKELRMLARLGDGTAPHPMPEGPAGDALYAAARAAVEMRATDWVTDVCPGARAATTWAVGSRGLVLRTLVTPPRPLERLTLTHELPYEFYPLKAEAAAVDETKEG